MKVVVNAYIPVALLSHRSFVDEALTWHYSESKAFSDKSIAEYLIGKFRSNFLFTTIKAQT